LARPLIRLCYLSPIGNAEAHPGECLPKFLKPLWWPVIAWTALWFAVNTGPWAFQHMPQGWMELFHAARALFPLAVLLGAAVLSARRSRRKAWTWPGPGRLWLLYGLIGLGACVMSPDPLGAGYWCAAYLAAFVAAKVFVEADGAVPVDRARHLNYLSWIINTTFLCIMFFVARDALFAESPTSIAGVSAYHVIDRMGEIGGMPMSRASGLARFAAVPGIVAFVFLWTSRGVRRGMWALVVGLCGVFIFLLQSRGAILGFGFAVVFVTLVLGTKSRIVAAAAALVAGTALFAFRIPEGLWEHITRGEGAAAFRELTGRPDYWHEAWGWIWRSPIWGWGGQADRYLMDWACVHNTYVYAVLQSGFIGAAAFVAGLGWAWVLFFREIKRRSAETPAQRAFLVQAGGILAFFTVRSIPEISGPLFGIDFLVMLPILAYLGALDREAACARGFGGAPRAGFGNAPRASA